MNARLIIFIRQLALAVTGVVLVAACSSAAAPLPSAGPASPAVTAPPSTGGAQPTTTSTSQPPDQPISAGPSAGGGGGVGQPKVVAPRPGATNVHPVSIEEIVAKIDGRRVKLNAIWWSGIEPCTILDSTAFKIDGSTITVSVREGTGNGEVACIDIAVQKVTVIDLGELDPGKYQIVPDQGTAPPLDITVG
jgi:ABC-type transport system substrate-binding protein